MSTRVVHLERTDRGAVLAGLRLVGPRSEESWVSPLVSVDDSEGIDRLDPAGDAKSTARSAAEWLKSSLRSGGGGKRIERLVLDADGAVCSWVTASGVEPKLVRALVDQHSGGGDSDGGFDGGGEQSHGRFPDLPRGEISAQALVEGVETSSDSPKSMVAGFRKSLEKSGQDDPDQARLAVMAVPDAPARMLIDELDRSGVQIGSVGTIFHAAASVWDASARRSTAPTEDGVIDAEPASECTAIIIVEPDGRLTWCWSIRGGVATSGSARLAGGIARAGGPVKEEGLQRRTDPVEVESPSVRVTSGVLARVSTEWLAWSSQLGLAPTKAVVVAPCSALEVGPPEANGSGGLDAPGIAAALRRVLPDATIDVVDDDDPVGLTLRRLAELHDDHAPVVAEEPGNLRKGLTALTRRPGRAHKAMYQWSAAALIAACVALGAIAIWLRGAAQSYESQAVTLKNSRTSLLESVDQTLLRSPFPVRDLERQVNEARNAKPPIEPSPPVIAELDTLSLLLGSDEYKLGSLSVNRLGGSFNVTVPDIGAAEDLREALRDIYGSGLIWSDPSITESGQNLTVRAQGYWPEPEGG